MCRGGRERRVREGGGEGVGVGVCTDPVRLLAAGIKYGSCQEGVCHNVKHVFVFVFFFTIYTPAF